AIDQSSFFSSAHAIRLPALSKYVPLLRPAGCTKVVSLPSTLDFMMRSLGWSVKKTLPSLSAAGPSVNEKSPESFSRFAPGAFKSTGAAWATAASVTDVASRVECRRRMVQLLLAKGAEVYQEAALAPPRRAQGAALVGTTSSPKRRPRARRYWSSVRS